MAETKVKAKVTAEKDAKGACPYCESVGQASSLIDVGNTIQCATCGKNWDKAAIGQKYSIALERGERWANEIEARRLKGQ